ncbi:hypothetical protein ANN_22063 [Periplaneta americana]|uniref:Reverse transcriptase domain-containing protein n=1 Tax=Periplaneta americana TaxID=6978 RepID=A0ABQ8S7L1_PERAM|nr:hypothetical protein ANN_22063 [Periplaneta americana]
MLGKNPQTVRENTGILLEASIEIGLEVNPEKIKYMIMSRDENTVRNGNIKIGNISFEEVEKFKYLGSTVTNINDTREEIKHRINMGNACYYSVEKLSSSSLLSKNLKVRIYKTVILPVVLYGCETWTLTVREERRLRVFENKVLRKIFGSKRDEVTGEWRKLHNTEVHALYSSPGIIRNIKSRRLRWAGHVARMGESRNAYRVLVGRAEGKKTFGEAETTISYVVAEHNNCDTPRKLMWPQRTYSRSAQPGLIETDVKQDAKSLARVPNLAVSPKGPRAREESGLPHICYDSPVTSLYRGASRSGWGKPGCDVGKRTSVPVRKYDSILKVLSSLENAKIFLERTILTRRPGSSVGRAAGYGLEGPGFDPRDGDYAVEGAQLPETTDFSQCKFCFNAIPLENFRHLKQEIQGNTVFETLCHFQIRSAVWLLERYADTRRMCEVVDSHHVSFRSVSRLLQDVAEFPLSPKCNIFSIGGILSSFEYRTDSRILNLRP